MPSEKRSSTKKDLLEAISPLAPHWSNFIVINNEIRNYIDQCGDSPSVYKTLTEWGVRQFDTDIYLDPYFFARNVASRLIRFVDKYLQLLGYDNFSNHINQSHEFLNALRHFQENGLRTLK